IAHLLRSRGAGVISSTGCIAGRDSSVATESRVALLMERSVEAVVSLLGVLKSGAAYVPLDAEYPTERLRFMLADSGAKILLTQRRVLDQIGWSVEDGVEVIAVDELPEELSEGSTSLDEQHASPVVTPQNLAYVIYTSGSTGTPKGVMV